MNFAIDAWTIDAVLLDCETGFRVSLSFKIPRNVARRYGTASFEVQVLNHKCVDFFEGKRFPVMFRVIPHELAVACVKTRKRSYIRALKKDMLV